MFLSWHEAKADEQDSLGSFLGGVLAGVLIGAALGVLLAPHRGDITRRKIARRAGETRDQVNAAMSDLRAGLEERREQGEGDS